MGGSGGGPDNINSSQTGLQNLLSQFSNSSNFNTSSNTTYPKYVLPYAQQFLQAYAGLAMPGGKIAGSPYAYQQVAPWTVPQEQAAQAVTSFGGTSPLITGAQTEYAKDLSGQYLSPNSNPALKSYYDAAADALTQQYKFATDPSLLAKGAQSGTLVSSPMVQANQLARYNLGQNLANLGAGIYEPAYQAERNIQQSAAAGSPSLVQGQYIPAQQLSQLGQSMQGQAQNVLNAAQGNLTQLGLWPYQALNMYGSALGPAAGPGSSTTTVGSGSLSGNSSSTGNSSGTTTSPNPYQTSK